MAIERASKPKPKLPPITSDNPYSERAAADVQRLRSEGREYHARELEVWAYNKDIDFRRERDRKCNKKDTVVPEAQADTKKSRLVRGGIVLLTALLQVRRRLLPATAYIQPPFLVVLTS